MGSRYLTDLADVCRAAGLAVVEVDGWQTRARGSGGYDDDRPWCVMWHHTASDTTPANDVNYIVHGCPDAPVANLYLARDGAVHVCAAGATNTNGKGGPFPVSRGTVPVDSMNTHAIGIEAGNDGIGEPWPAEQIAAYFTLSRALTGAYGLAVTDLATHAEWAPGRKIDPATADAVEGPWQPSSINSSGTWNPDDVRAEAARIEPPPEPPPKEDDMPLTFVAAAPGWATCLIAIDGAGTSTMAFVTEEDRIAISTAIGNPPIVHISTAQMDQIVAVARSGEAS
jgi:hypothetical protein